MKIILNVDYGGFGVSKKAYELYAKKKNLELFCYKREINDINNPIYKYAEGNNLFNCYFTKDFGNNVLITNEDYEKYNLYLDESYRLDPILIEVVEELGIQANGRFGSLKVVEIPNNSFYVISDYDGVETLYYSESEIKEI